LSPIENKRKRERGGRKEEGEGGGETRKPEPTRRTGFVHCLLIEENRRNNS
jgi:hypothetical protein